MFYSSAKCNMLNSLKSRRIIQQSEEKPNTAGSYICSWIGWPWLTLQPSSPSLSSLSISFPIHFLYCLSPTATPLHWFFESVFLVRRRERGVSGGLSFLRTGPANMVYSCPETVSDMYVNQGGRLQKRREDGREGGREREYGGRSFANMPSHGSLQQAVKVRPGRGERERREREKKTLSGFVELFLLQVEKRFASVSGEPNWFLLAICLEKCTYIYHSKLYWSHMCTTKLDEC